MSVRGVLSVREAVSVRGAECERLSVGEDVCVRRAECEGG